jgi:hypothetical protein
LNGMLHQSRFPPNSVAPDYIKCGSTVIYVTWKKILVIFLILFSTRLFLNTLFDTSSNLLTNDDRLYPNTLLGGAASPSPITTKQKSATKVNTKTKTGVVRGLLSNVLSSRLTTSGSVPLPTAIPPFCIPHASTYYFDLWKLAYLGSSKDFPSSELVSKDINEDSTIDGKKANSGLLGSRPKIGDSLCEWVDRTATDVSFSMCTFDTSIDVQISLYLHKEKVWNSWKKGLMEDLLPRINSLDIETRTLEGRTVVIDVGANLGFFTLLALKRGYDVLAFEPAKEALLRLLISAADNNIQVATSPSDRAEGFGSLGAQSEDNGGRKPILYAFLNAVHDAYSSATLDYVQDNPGASWISSLTTPPSTANPSQRVVSTVYIDDIVYVRDIQAEKAQEALQHKLKKKGGNTGTETSKKGNLGDSGASRIQKQAAAAGIVLAQKKKDESLMSSSPKGDTVYESKDATIAPDSYSNLNTHAPTGTSSSGKAGLLLHPSKVRLIKISAEGMDSRVLNGMRRLLAVGRIPFILFVYNSAHVKNAGCDNEKLVHSMIEYGYQLWHGGTFFKRPIDVERFVRGMTGRSIELLFVGPDTTWY